MRGEPHGQCGQIFLSRRSGKHGQGTHGEHEPAADGSDHRKPRAPATFRTASSTQSAADYFFRERRDFILPILLPAALNRD